MKIGVIGAGRLGICFALLCEQSGYDVVVSDIREDYIQDLKNKKITTNEPEVQELLSKSKNIKATTDNFQVIRECDIIYTLVATPSLPSGYSHDNYYSSFAHETDLLFQSTNKIQSANVAPTTVPHPRVNTNKHKDDDDDDDEFNVSGYNPSGFANF